MSRKFCVLPGQPIVRIAKTDGRVVLIGETPREIPEDMEREAIAAGAFSDDQLADIKSRLLGTGISAAATVAAAPVSPPADDEKPPVQPPADAVRVEKIRLAAIEILNNGNPDDCTTGGKPKVPALEALLGFDITGEERDAAYTAAKG